MSYYIYKICCDDLPDFVYVGSTKAFRQRKRQHKSNCNNDKDKIIIINYINY
jgi:predicted GIY-YIG superfamily endonuclease